MNSKPTYVYIGGGAAGYFAAVNGAERNANALHILLEATHRPMTKIKISGGGRCNVTHHCFDPNALVKNYPRGSKELLGAFFRFQPQDTIAWFAKRGVSLKVEADGRMFPITDNSNTIISCFNQEVERLQVEVRKGSKVTKISKSEKKFIISLHGGSTVEAHQILLATGSVPLGYELAASLGHKIIEPCPSLFTFNCSHALLHEMMGTSFKQVSLILEIEKDNKKQTWQQNGPLLITHWGLSGPSVLKLSAFAARQLHESQYKAKLKVNWVGITKYDEVLNHLTNLKNQDPKKAITNLICYDLSKRFWQQIITFAIPDKKNGLCSELSKADLRKLTDTLVNSELQIDGKGIFKEEFVSCGGVDLKEINFKTMESRICPGLFFAGEILNIDGITGGFNFQNAWTTAWIAAQSMGVNPQTF